MLTSQELIDFETAIATAFNNAEIPYPIHLSRGNELPLIEIFKDFKKGDWCFSQWRNHYHALLTGIPPEEVKRQIMSGRSMTICSPQHRFFASAIVAGIIPIAVGVAWQIKKSGGSEHVFCFIGEMTAETGISHECIKYSTWNDLPITFIIEDNGRSVCTNTKEVWGNLSNWKPHEKIMYYKFDPLEWPHAGAGRRIQF